MSLAPARTVAPRSSIEPAVACAPARNFSNALRACSKLASAIDRMSFGISKRSRPSSRDSQTGRSSHSDEFGHVTAMNNPKFQLRGIGDPRLAVHATSALPAWLWSVDGTRILWANPVGARLFGAPNAADLAKKVFA